MPGINSLRSDRSDPSKEVSKHSKLVSRIPSLYWHCWDQINNNWERFLVSGFQLILKKISKFVGWTFYSVLVAGFKRMNWNICAGARVLWVNVKSHKSLKPPNGWSSVIYFLFPQDTQPHHSFEPTPSPQKRTSRKKIQHPQNSSPLEDHPELVSG